MSSLDLRSVARPLAESLRGSMPAYPHLYDAAIETWRLRMRNEHGSSRVFSSLAEQMTAAGFDSGVIDEVRAFAKEEEKHGALCGSVVEALGGEAIVPVLPEAPFPWHTDLTPLEGVLCNLLSISCLSETIAVALIGAERFEMPEGRLRDLLTEIWADEVGHARFGWRIVSDRVEGLSAESKARLSEYLRAAFAHLEEHELAHLPLAAQPPAEGVSLGLCSGKDARALFYDTIRSAILPPLDALGLSATNAWNTRYSRMNFSQASGTSPMSFSAPARSTRTNEN